MHADLLKWTGIAIQIGTIVFVLGGVWAVWKYQIKDLRQKSNEHEERLNKKHDRIEWLDVKTKQNCREIERLDSRVKAGEEMYLTQREHLNLCGKNTADLQKGFLEGMGAMNNTWADKLEKLYVALDELKKEISTINVNVASISKTPK